MASIQRVQGAPRGHFQQVAFGSQVEYCKCKVFRGESFDVAVPAQPALCCQMRCGRLFGMFPQRDVGDSILPFCPLYCEQRSSVKAINSVSQGLVERPSFCSKEKDGENGGAVDP